MADVRFTEPAEYDLLDIEYYIFVNLCNPKASKRITEGILSTAERLGSYPTVHPFVNDQLLECLGLRMTRFDNYNIFYHYDENTDIVHIIRILYNRIDWQTLFRS